ncbi:GPI10 [Symbiodinium sp. CCMP2456]|nr:GPI10 [Symbiodinium sp. CCMP2456]
MKFEPLESPVADEFVRIIGSGLEPSDKDEEEKLEESDQSQVQESISISETYQRAANYIADFQATRRDIVRAAPCYEALRGFGRAFRFPKAANYHRSFPTDNIQEFWSHSWHGSALRKISTLMVQKNGLAAISAGSLASLLLVGLFAGGYLPGYERAPFQRTGRDSYLFGVWGMVGGTLVAIVTIIFWRCRTPVFVDVMCIHQSDPSLKSEALLSMGAFLQSSESLHVWWDETFVERQGGSRLV